MSDDEVRAATSADPGFAGPIGASGGHVDCIALPLNEPLICGESTDAHLVGLIWERDAP